MQPMSVLLIGEVCTDAFNLSYSISCSLLGKSDPYAVFTLNNNKVFKSEVKKKTLSPTWDETFTVMVVSYNLQQSLWYL